MSKKLTKKRTKRKQTEVEHKELRALNGWVFRYATFDQIKAVLKPNAFAAFQEWMTGQTYGLIDGVGYVYGHDFERWVRSAVNGEILKCQKWEDWD